MPTCLSALSCYLVIGWLEIYVNEQFNWCKMAGERILWGFIFTKPAGKFQKIIFLHESPPVFPKNNFRVLAQIRVMSRTSVFLIADSVQSLELIPAVIEQNSGYTLVMSPVRRPIHPHTPIQTWVKGFKLTNSSKEKEEAFICCSACWTVQINSVKTRDHNWPVDPWPCGGSSLKRSHPSRSSWSVLSAAVSFPPQTFLSQHSLCCTVHLIPAVTTSTRRVLLSSASSFLTFLLECHLTHQSRNLLTGAVPGSVFASPSGRPDREDAKC